MSGIILEFKSVYFSVNKISLLDNVSFVVKENSIHAVLGPNGAGKSTSLKLASSLIKPTSGSISIAGRDIKKRENLRRIGSLIDTVSLYNHLSVIDNLYISALQRKIQKSDILETLEIVGLASEAKKKAKDLSMGMRQRLGIAQAIIHKPKLLLLDEPTNGLDPQGVLAIRELLIFLNSSLNVAIVFTTHILSEVDKIADDITLINKGIVTYSGSAKNFNNGNNLEEEYLNRVVEK